MTVRLSGDRDLGTHRVGEPVDVTLVLENEGRPVRCWLHPTAGDVLFPHATHDGEPFTMFFRPPGIPPLAARPRETLGKGQRRELTIAHLLFHWQNPAPGHWTLTIRLALDGATTSEHTLTLTLMP